MLHAQDLAMSSQQDRSGCWMHRRRRWAVVGSAVLLCAVLLWALQGPEKSLSPAERALVGVWGHPQIESPLDHGVPAGPMSNPWEFMELARDGSYRAWFASAETPGVRYPLTEGRWGVIDDRLQIEDIPHGARRFARDVQFQLSVTTGLLPTPRRIHSGTSLEYQLNGSESLVLIRTPRAWTFERLRRNPDLAPDPALLRTRPSAVAPGTIKAPPGGQVR
jgi:hypothetical protein